MEEKCSLCARSEISSAARIRQAAEIRQQTTRKAKTRVRRILPPVKLLYTGVMSPHGSPGYNSGYTVDMKTAVSLPDELFRRAEAIAHRLRVSRSQLYSRA